MANVLGELLVKITGDSAQFDKSITNSENKLKAFGQKAGEIGKKLTTSVTLPIVGIGAALAKSAIDAEETRSKYATVFRELGAGAEVIADTFADSFGLAGTKARELLGDTGDLLTGLGFTADEAIELSRQVNELAVDLASFTNFSGGAEGASQALTKALLGEREGVKSLGIAIGEADINRLAEDKGIVGELDRQTKAALTLELALQQSKNAIGDFERTQDSAANQIRQLQGDVQDLAEEFGRELLPIVKDLLVFARDVVEGFTDLDQGTKTLILTVGGLAALAGPISSLFGLFATAGPVGLAIAGIVALGAALNGVGGLIDILIETEDELVNNADAIRDQRVALEEQKEALENSADSYTKDGGLTDAVKIQTKELEKNIEQLKQQEIQTILTARAQIQAQQDLAKETILQSISIGESFSEGLRNLKKEGIELRSLAIYEELGEDIQNLNNRLRDLGVVVGDFTEEQKGQITSIQEYYKASFDASEATRTRTEATKQDIEIKKESKEVIEEETEAIKDNSRVIKAQQDLILFGGDLVKETQEEIYATWDEIGKKLVEQNAIVITEMNEQWEDHSDKVVGNLEEMARSAEDIFQDVVSGIELITNAFGGYIDARINQIDAEAKASGELTEKQKKEKRDLLTLNKALAVTESIINTAIAVTKALPNVPLAILVGALGLAETVAIASTPIPALADGGLVLPSAGGSQVIMAEAGVPEFAVPERQDVLGRLADDIVSQIPGISGNAFGNSGVNFPDKIKINIDGKEFAGWVSEQSRNGRIIIDKNRGISR